MCAIVDGSESGHFKGNERLEDKVLYRFYVILGTACFLLFRPLKPLVRLVGGRFGYGLDERFGHYPISEPVSAPEPKRIWIHAASVGEVQAAANLIAELQEQGEFRFFLTVMTEQGHRVAEKKLSGRATCLMAPFDVPFIVRQALVFIRPDLFVCVETELWPALLSEVRKAGVGMCLVNGRMSERSFRRYVQVKGLMQRLLAGFSAVTVIRPEDGERFAALGVDAERIRVSGNSKYAQVSVDREQVRNQYRKRLGLDDATVFICGSTRTGEEELLVPVYQRLREQCKNRLLWIIAPRHLERIPALRTFFARNQMDTTLFTSCTAGQCSADILLVDCMGELANLYAAGDYNFCGGSLMELGGHNIMEAVRWGLPVYFGPSMQDFHDAVELVVPVGAGFQVADAEELAALLACHVQNRELYEQACKAALGITLLQCGAVREQAEMVRGLIEHSSAPY